MLTRRGFFTALAALPVAAVAALKAKPKPDGLSVRFVKHYDITAHGPVTRFDVLYGIGNLTPDYAIRVPPIA